MRVSERIKAAADFVCGDSLWDIGCDHGLLFAYLLINKKIKRAIASDILEGPLLKARATVLRYNLEDCVQLILSDGIKAGVCDVSDIAILGMGGELIASIIEKDIEQFKGKNLILGPMSRDERLRGFLFENGFSIKEEVVVIERDKIYSIINTGFTGEKFECDEVYNYIGKIDIATKKGQTYLEKQIKLLAKKCIKEPCFKGVLLKLERMVENENHS